MDEFPQWYFGLIASALFAAFILLLWIATH